MSIRYTVGKRKARRKRKLDINLACIAFWLVFPLTPSNRTQAQLDKVPFNRKLPNVHAVNENTPIIIYSPALSYTTGPRETISIIHLYFFICTAFWSLSKTNEGKQQHKVPPEIQYLRFSHMKTNFISDYNRCCFEYTIQNSRKKLAINVFLKNPYPNTLTHRSCASGTLFERTSRSKRSIYVNTHFEN